MEIKFFDEYTTEQIREIWNLMTAEEKIQYIERMETIDQIMKGQSK